MTQWHKTKFIDLCTLKRGYDLPAQNRKSGDIPIYSSSGIVGYHNQKKCSPLGVITGRYGTIGSVFLSKKDFWPLNTTLYVEDFKENDRLFIYYFLKTLPWEKFNDKSAVPGINRNHIHDEIIYIPPLAEQKAIAAVLGSLDDKIDLLHRQNATLERMAETLFRQWFIEEAQEDWDETTIGNIVEIKGGSTPSTKQPELWNGDIYWTSPRDIANLNSIFLFSTERTISEKGLAKISSGLLPKGTLLLSSRAPIGYLAITEIELAINQGYIAILHNNNIPNYYMFLWCKCNMETIKAAGNGSVFQEISKSVFRSLPFRLPPLDLMKKFQQIIEPLFQKIRLNQQQIQTLEKLRDTLLPKLMSGEVRVRVDE